MKVVDHTKPEISVLLSSVCSRTAFWYVRKLWIKCGLSARNGYTRIQRLDSGETLDVARQTKVELEPDAEIHIGPHPAEEKLKRLLAGLREIFRPNIFGTELTKMVEEMQVLYEAEKDDNE